MNGAWQEVVVFFKNIMPGEASKFLMGIGGFAGFWFSFALGGMDNMILCLAVMAALDYATGIIAAFKSCQWCSSVGFKGIAKKVVMFAIVALCHGLDQTTGLNVFRSMAVFAYAVNETGSIIENVDACGWGKYIPAFLRDGLKKIKDEHKI